MNTEKLARLQAISRERGKGQPRRKTVVANRGSSQDLVDATLKKHNFKELKKVLQVNIFGAGSEVFTFESPDVQASFENNSVYIKGRSDASSILDLSPDIFEQLGPKLSAQVQEEMDVL